MPWGVLIVVLCALLSPGLPSGQWQSVAPNTVRRAFGKSVDAVVKLYGGKLGREHGYGTGFLVSTDGRIVTVLSLLVVGHDVRAVLADGREYTARVVQTDDYRQLALLQIDAEGLPFLPLARGDSIRIGDPVIALGNWFKIAEGSEAVSVIRGIVSLKTNLTARRLTQDFAYRGPVLIYDAITSNPGAPGGPVLDLQGRCIGMIGRIVESAGTNTRLNYALPSEEIIAFLSENASGKKNKRAGPSSAPAEPEQALGRAYLGIRLSKLGFHQVSAYVQRVRSDSPAAAAGIRPDDLIVSIEGWHIGDADDYKAAVERLTPGQVARFVVKRGPQVMTLNVKVGAK